jgi:hypothetical protein
MSAALSLDQMLAERRVWRGQPTHAPAPRGLSTGLAALDAALPHSGWPPAALTEVLIPADGVGELSILWPSLAQITRDGGRVVVVAPPYIPYAPSWHLAGIALPGLDVVRAQGRDALWAAEQCLRSGACAAVLCWPAHADDRALRRLQVAAETGQALGFAFRSIKTLSNPSPAALRIAIETRPRQLRVVKCRGAMPPNHAIALSSFSY